MCYYKVNVVICMVLRRYVLKSLSTTFEGKGLKYFGNMYQSNCQVQYVPSCHNITDITSLSTFFGFFIIADRCYFEKVSSTNLITPLT